MKNIKDYIHLYIGCPVFLGNNIEENPVIEPLTLKMAHEDLEMFEDEVQRYELMLRRLSDLNHDDMLGLLISMIPDEMEDKPSEEDYSLTMFYNDDGLMVDGDVIVGANYSVICYEGQIAIRECGSIMLFGEDGNQERPVNIVQGFHYLLNQGFDLFGLIDTGLAIDATPYQKDDKTGIVRLCHALAEDVSKDAESAEAYLKSEGVDVEKVKADGEWLAWKTKLMSIVSQHTGEWPKINDAEAKQWYNDGYTPEQCFRETWQSDGD